MPELPEIETIRRSLLFLEGKTISRVEVLRPKSVRELTAREFASRLENRKILTLERRGKYLLWQLAGRQTMVVHLRMTGQLLWYPETLPVDKHTAAIWSFQELRGQLRLVDIRTFATINLVPQGEYQSITGLANLSPELLAADYPAPEFWQKLKRRRSPLKSVLLDQRLFAGVGNIYADEALFRAKLNPLASAAELSWQDYLRLLAAVRAVLTEGIENHGTTFRNYVDGRGQKGGFQNKLAVYGRRGEACHVCQTPIQRIVVAGRGTFFCPRCQGKATA